MRRERGAAGRGAEAQHGAHQVVRLGRRGPRERGEEAGEQRLQLRAHVRRRERPARRRAAARGRRRLCCKKALEAVGGVRVDDDVPRLQQPREQRQHGAQAVNGQLRAEGGDEFERGRFEQGQPVAARALRLRARRELRRDGGGVEGGDVDKPARLRRTQRARARAARGEREGGKKKCWEGETAVRHSRLRAVRCGGGPSPKLCPHTPPLPAASGQRRWRRRGCAHRMESAVTR